MVISKPANWTQAKQGCLSRNSQLVTIANNEENKFVADLADDVSWIGAQWNELMKDYNWVDGSEIGFTKKWINKTMDSSLCVGICENVSFDQQCGSVGEWQQDQCVHLKSFVCEREGTESVIITQSRGGLPYISEGVIVGNFERNH